MIYAILVSFFLAVVPLHVIQASAPEEGMDHKVNQGDESHAITKDSTVESIDAESEHIPKVDEHETASKLTAKNADLHENAPSVDNKGTDTATLPEHVNEHAPEHAPEHDSKHDSKHAHEHANDTDLAHEQQGLHLDHGAQAVAHEQSEHAEHDTAAQRSHDNTESAVVEEQASTHDESHHKSMTNEESAGEKAAPSDEGHGTSSVGNMPSVPEEQHEQEPGKEEEVDEAGADAVPGIDTLGLEEPRGNWLFKRIWWERAEARYDKIRQTVYQINDVYIKFFKQRTELDKQVFDPFYLDIGFKQGELQAQLSDLIEMMEKEQRESGELSENQREQLASMQEDREMLQTSYRNAQSILLLSQAADDIIDRVMQQKGRVAQYEQDAWRYMRDIARILSDKQARDLYYKMDAAWRNIKSIHQYLEQDLQHYFVQLIENAKTQVAQIRETVQALKEKGIDLKMKVQHFDQEAEPEQEEQAEEPVAPKPKKPKGFMGYAKWAVQGVSDVVLWIPRKIWGLVSGLFGFKK